MTTGVVVVHSIFIRPKSQRVIANGIVAYMVICALATPWLIHHNNYDICVVVIQTFLNMGWYLTFIINLRNSVSLRIIESALKSGGKIADADLSKTLSQSHLVDSRLGDLVRSKLIFAEGNRFALTPKGRLLARGFRLAQWIWGVKNGGY